AQGRPAAQGAQGGGGGPAFGGSRVEEGAGADVVADEHQIVAVDDGQGEHALGGGDAVEAEAGVEPQQQFAVGCGGWRGVGAEAGAQPVGVEEGGLADGGQLARGVGAGGDAGA